MKYKKFGRLFRFVLGVCPSDLREGCTTLACMCYYVFSEGKPGGGFRTMELKHFEEFIALAKSLNFSETANDLHLAQPTLSKHMALLEAELDVKLFERSSTKVELTEEGFYFLGTAVGVVGQLNQAKRDLAVLKSRKPIYVEGRFEDAAISGLISLVSSAAAEQGLPPIVFNHNSSKTPLTLLLDGDIDLLIDMLPIRHNMPDAIGHHELFSRPFVAVMDADHPLANKESLRIAELKDATLVQLLWENYQPGWEKIEELCLANGFEPKRKPVAVRSQAEGLVSMPKGCVLIFPGAAKELKYLERSTSRRFVAIEDERAVFTTHALFRKDRREKIAAFLDLFDQAVTLMERSA